MNRIKLWSVTWETTTAGPSPDKNNRTEVFLFGCKRAKDGNPCKGCFNSDLWDSDKAEKDYTPEEIASQIIEHAPNKYVTIGGGEPTDQMEGLIELCKLLKKAGFHIMVYTWRSLKRLLPQGHHIEYVGMTSDHVELVNMRKNMRKLLTTIDMLVDGQFMLEERLYQSEKDDGLLNSVGSGNQIIWDVKNYNTSLWPASVSVTPYIEGYALRDLDALFIKDNDDLLYIVKSMEKEPDRIMV